MKQESTNKLVKISSVIAEIYGDELHKKRQQSPAYAAMGVLARESLFYIVYSRRTKFIDEEI